MNTYNYLKLWHVAILYESVLTMAPSRMHRIPRSPQNAHPSAIVLRHGTNFVPKFRNDSNIRASQSQILIAAFQMQYKGFRE